MRAISAVALSLLLVLSAGVARAAEAQHSRIEFRDAVKTELRRVHPGIVITNAGDEDVAISKPTEVRVYTGNLYNAYANGALGFEEAVSRLARTLPAENIPKPQKAELVALVRPLDFERPYNTPILQRTLAGGLGEFLAFDGAETFHYASKTDLSALSLTEEKAWQAAHTNIPLRAGHVSAHKIDTGVWEVTSDTDFADSLMLSDAWRRPEIELQGAPVFVCLKRNLLIVADSADGPALRRLRTFLVGAMADPDTMSVALVFHPDGRWRTLE